MISHAIDKEVVYRHHGSVLHIVFLSRLQLVAQATSLSQHHADERLKTSSDQWLLRTKSQYFAHQPASS
jgi:hypothetical protein